MAILSSLDLLVVILASLPIVALSIYKSWKWQHGWLGLTSRPGTGGALVEIGDCDPSQRLEE